MKNIRNIITILIFLGISLLVLCVYSGIIMGLWNNLASFLDFKKLDFTHSMILLALIKVLTSRIFTKNTKKQVTAHLKSDNAISRVPRNYN